MYRDDIFLTGIGRKIKLGENRFGGWLLEVFKEIMKKITNLIR